MLDVEARITPLHVHRDDRADANVSMLAFSADRR
jgi:hypothetical protein